MADAGKNKRRQLEALDTFHEKTLSVDSMEESDFLNFLCEAAELSIIQDFQYQPESFILFDNTKYTDVYGKSRTLYQQHQYTCDFCIQFDPKINLEFSKEFKIPYELLSCDTVSAYIDTKGLFNKNSRSFSTDRKWVWEKFKTYVHEVIPQKFFAKFGVPRKSFNSQKTKKARKMFLGMKSIKEMFFKEEKAR